MRRGPKLLLLGSLYFSQGLPYGFFVQGLPVILRMSGHSLTVISLSTLLYLPWALKFLWAPLVDRYGNRRSWIIPLQVLSCLVMGLLAWFDPANSLVPLLIGICLVNLLAATQDIATDALSVDLLPPHERGVGKAVQGAGYRSGMIIGGGALLMVMTLLGWWGAFMSMTILLALATIPVLLFREPDRHAGRTVPELRELIKGLSESGINRWLLLLLVYKAGEGFASGMLRPYLVDAGLTIAEIGLMLGTVGFAAGLAGAVLGGLMINPLGRRNCLLLFGLLQSLAVFGYQLAAIGVPSRLVLYSVCTLEHFAAGMATAALFTVMMDACRPHAAATDYTLQASLVVVATGVFSALSGPSAHALGYPWHFGLSGVICLLAVLYVWNSYRETITEAAPQVS